MALARKLLLLLLLCTLTDMAHAAPETVQNIGMKMKSIDQVLHDQRDWIMSVPGVAGTGIGLCGGCPCIKVYASKPASTLADKLPGQLDGYAVEIEETGPIRALPDGQ